MLSNEWVKSTLSGSSGGGCVEARVGDDGRVLVRDSKQHGQGPVLAFTESEWRAFVGGVELGEFDLPGMPQRN